MTEMDSMRGKRQTTRRDDEPAAEEKKGTTGRIRKEHLKKTRVEIYTTPPEGASHTCLRRAIDVHRGPRTRERATPLPIMATPEECLEKWLTVEQPRRCGGLLARSTWWIGERRG